MSYMIDLPLEPSLGASLASQNDQNIPSWPAAVSSERFLNLLLSLPRELRDEIFSEAMKASTCYFLSSPPLLRIPAIFQTTSQLAAEALQAFYQVNSFFVDFQACPEDFLDELTTAYAEPKLLIRHLVIDCSEYPAFCGVVTRLKWEQLLEMPRLESLTINMQKERDASLCTSDFGPILYALRAKTPDIKITFNLTFDAILWGAWNDPRWNGLSSPGNVVPYSWMGYVDMSDLVAPVTEEDMVYVQQHLHEHWKNDTMPSNRSIKDGLLAETVANRRTLAQHYAVFEPALLRCRMAEDYKIYQKGRADKSERKEST